MNDQLLGPAQHRWVVAKASSKDQSSRHSAMWRPRISTRWSDDSCSSTSNTAEAFTLSENETLSDLRLLQNFGSVEIDSDVRSAQPSTSRWRRRGRRRRSPVSPASVKRVRLATRCSRARMDEKKLVTVQSERCRQLCHGTEFRKT